MTRIIAGEARGRRLRTPVGDGTRPTSDRVREALFSSLESELGTLSGRRFLDLYAGSGAVGLEAMSRGASAATLVEQHPAAIAAIRANVARLGFAGVTVSASRAERFAHHAVGSDDGFDVVFADPPYAATADEVGGVLVQLHAAGWLREGALVVVERPRRQDWAWPAGYEEVRSRKYGETMLWYGRLSPPGLEEV